MADQFAVVSFDVSATGSFNVTSGAITETVKAAILVLTHTQTDDANAAHGIMAMGFVADDGDPSSLNKLCCGYRSTDALTVTQITDSWKYSNGVVLGLFSENSTDAADVEITFTAFISGGITLNCTTFGGTACRGYAILFAGVSRAYVDTVVPTTVSGSENCGALSTFQPDLLVFMGSDGNFGGPGGLDTAIATLGFVAGSSTVSSLIHWNSGADPSDGDGRVSDGTLRTVNVLRTQASITITIDSTGFDHIASTGSPDMAYLALKFSETLPIKVDNLAVSGSAGTQSFAVGFQPQIVFGQSTLITAEDTDTDGSTASSVGLFAFTSTTERAASMHSQEGITVTVGTPTDANTRQGSHALLTLSHTGTVAQEAELSSMTATGFDLSFGTATAGLMTLVAIGFGAQTIVQSDTESIADQSVLILNRDMVLSDTVTITDNVEDPFTTNVTVTGGPQGTTYEGTAERGASYSGGAEAGVVL